MYPCWRGSLSESVREADSASFVTAVPPRRIEYRRVIIAEEVGSTLDRLTGPASETMRT
jgi:hypothetical protein